MAVCFDITMLHCSLLLLYVWLCLDVWLCTVEAGTLPLHRFRACACIVQSSSSDTQWEGETVQKSERPELGAARVVISGTEGCMSLEP